MKLIKTCAFILSLTALVFTSCGNLASGGKIDPDGKYGSLVINQEASRSLNISDLASTATVQVMGNGMTSVSGTASLSAGSGSCVIENIPAGTNRVVKVNAKDANSNNITMYAVTDINAYTDGTKNSVTVNWANSREGVVWASLVSADSASFSKVTVSGVKTALSELNLSSVHASLIDGAKVADYVLGKTTSITASDCIKAGTVSVTAASSCTVQICDPASSKATISGTSGTISNVTPGTWKAIVTTGTTSKNYSVTVTAGGTATLNAGSAVSEKSVVMLQGFTWNSAPRGSYTKENPSPYWYKWYGIMKNRASDIKDTFGYVWFNPPSICDSNSSEGYAPTQLNDLNSYYGTADELKEVISAISPAKAIADIVVNHRAGTTCWGDFTNPDWGVVKGSTYTAICSDDEAFDSTSGDTAHMVGKPSGAADTGASYGAYRDLDHTNSTVQQGIIDWMNDVLKPAGFVGWRYDYVKGYGGKYVGQYNKGSSAEFSVGEYWPSSGYNSSTRSTWGSEIKSWISATASGGTRSRAFDFTLKGAMNEVFGCTWIGDNNSQGTNTGSFDYSILADSNNLVISQPSDAVTFIDNHDTGSNQGHWELNRDYIGVGYALILTHPGVPCVAWSHYFTFAEGGNGDTTYPYSGLGAAQSYIAGNTVPGTSNTLRQHIDYLINLRKEMGIEYDSVRTTLNKSNSNYTAEITGTNGSVIVEIGEGYSVSDSDYTLVYSGNKFAIWTKGGSSSSTCKTPVITISDGKATITCGTSGAAIHYGFSSAAMTKTYTSAVTMTEGDTIYAYASCDGYEDSGVASKTYTAGNSLTVTADSWTWTTASVFAWVWEEGSDGSWVECTGSGSTVYFTAPANCNYFLLVRCPTGTTTPSWTATGDTAGRIYNKTANTPITSSTTYTVSFSDYTPS